MVKGTKYLFGKELELFDIITGDIKWNLEHYGFQQFIPSALSEQSVFIDKAGPEVLGQMYTFKDKKERDICLIPEVTAVVQKIYNEEWSKTLPKPIKLYYLTRCYRYEKPQAGRYREFWQLGIEILGGDPIKSKQLAINTLESCIISATSGYSNFKYEFKENVKRGLDYYIEDGFEIDVPILGAQKQIAGGGRYKEGVGWAIGVDRLILALKKYGF